MEKYRNIKVKLFDSLGKLITSYDTKISEYYYQDLLAIAEETDNGLIAIKDTPVDDELGYREYLL